MHFISDRRNGSLKRPSIVGALIAAIFFGGLGGGAWYLGKPIWDKADASSEWPTVSGVIEKSELKTSRSKEGNLLYAHNIEYQYVIDGKKLTNRTVWIGDGYSSSNDDAAKETVTKYHPGKRCESTTIPIRGILQYWNLDDLFPVPGSSILRSHFGV